MSGPARKKSRPLPQERSLTAAELRALNAWFQLIPSELQTKPFVLAGAKALIDPRFRARLIAKVAKRSENWASKSR